MEKKEKKILLVDNEPYYPAEEFEKTIKMFIAGAIAALSTRAENRRSVPGATV